MRRRSEKEPPDANGIRHRRRTRAKNHRKGICPRGRAATQTHHLDHSRTGRIGGDGWSSLSAIQTDKANNIFAEKSEEQRILALNDVGYMIQDEIILATLVEDGYTRTILVPERADRFSYEVSSTPVSVVLTSGKVTMTYLIPNITGSVSKGHNTITKTGTVTVN